MGGRIGDLSPDLRPFANRLVHLAGRAGLQPRITSTIRTRSEQRRLFNRYLANQSGYPVAPPGFSAHEYGEAFDMVLSPLSALVEAGAVWKSWGGGWTGSDAVHFELPGATARAQRQGQLEGLSETPAYAGRVAHGLAFAFDLIEGSGVAGLLTLFPWLRENQALNLLSQPAETILAFLERNL